MCSTGPTKWGIISCGRISHDWWVGFSTLPREEHVIVGAAARNFEAAQTFVKEHGIPKAYKNYVELLQDPEVEVVYIGTVHTEHLKLCKLVLDYGKHVLCEKPLAMNVRETKEIIDYARSKNKFFMEAIWSRFFPAVQRFREELEKGTVGEILQVVADMGVIFDMDDWRMDRANGGGTTLDIGTYTIQFTTMVFKGLRPEKIVAAGTTNSSGADVSASATLIFPGGKTATIFTHNLIQSGRQAIAIGTKGILKLEAPFWSPERITVEMTGEPSTTFEYPLPKHDNKEYYMHSVGLGYQCHEVRRCILQGLRESPLMSWDDTLLIAEIRESIRKQIGVTYAQD